MFERVTVDPDQMDGMPCIRGLRIPVATVVRMVADGMTADEIVSSHPDLEPEDVREALRFAASAVAERVRIRAVEVYNNGEGTLAGEL